MLRSESLLNEAQHIAHTGSWTTDLRSKKDIRWSDEFFRLLGYEPGKMEPSFDLFARHLHPDDMPKLLERSAKNPSDHASHGPQDYRILRREG